MRVKVAIVEADERSSEVTEVKNFPTQRRADKFVKIFNTKHERRSGSVWWMYAKIMEED